MAKGRGSKAALVERTPSPALLSESGNTASKYAGSLDILENMGSEYPCRDTQIKTLVSLYDQSFTPPPTLIVHGLEATGKSTIVKNILQGLPRVHAVVDSKQCVTSRHMLEQTALLSRQALAQAAPDDHEIQHLSRCETVNSLQNYLETILKDGPHFTLVLDGVDHQRESSPALLPALVRLGHIIPNLSIILIISVPSPRLFSLPGMPHLHFSTYNKDESVKILAVKPPHIFLQPVDSSYDYSEEVANEDRAWLWPKFCTFVWDALAKGAARDLRTFALVCKQLWRPFVQPIIDGNFGTRDFLKLLISRRTIFQDETFLGGNNVKMPPRLSGQSRPTNEMPYHTKFLLCAAYLASYNPARLDRIYFMKGSDGRRKRRGGGAVAGRPSKNRKIPRHLLNPSPFPLDRLLAILQALLPHSLVQTGQISAQIATLTSLRLLLRSGISATDPLDPVSRFRVNCSWEYVSSLGRSVGIEMQDYLAT